MTYSVSVRLLRWSDDIEEDCDIDNGTVVPVVKVSEFDALSRLSSFVVDDSVLVFRVKTFNMGRGTGHLAAVSVFVSVLDIIIDRKSVV